MPKLEALGKRLAGRDAEMAETRQRLPAHSVKPTVTQMLLDLEDEYDTITRATVALRGRGSQ